MITITEQIADQLFEHARQAAPNECCGVLAGKDSGHKTQITSRYSATNIAEASEREYHIDPEELIGIINRIEQTSQSVIGFYHSHPTGPCSPSETDHQQAAWVDHLYVIVSLDPERIAGWIWTGKTFDKVEIQAMA